MKYKTSLGEEIDNALAELDELLSDGTLEFLSELWDTERGGFYRTSEERDKRGELPDIDSTAQVVSLLSSGAIKGTKGKLLQLLPAEIKEKILDFAGFNAKSDAAKFKAICEKLGEKNENATPSKAKGAERGENGDHLKSKEAFLEYLRELDGAELFKVREKLSDIRAAGLSDTLFAYLDDEIKSDYGYGELARLSKIITIYNEELRPIKNAREIASSLVNLVCSDSEPSNIANLYALWTSLYGVVKNIGEESERCAGGEEKRALYSALRARAPEIIGETVKKLSRFKNSDGGFSYYASATRTTFGALSGDVNSTVTAVHGIRGNVFACLGLTTPPLYEESALDAFSEALISARKIKKKFLFFKI